MGAILIALLGAVSALVAVCRTGELRRDREAEARWLADDEPYWVSVRADA